MTTALDALDVLRSFPIWGVVMKVASDRDSVVGMTRAPAVLTPEERANIRTSLQQMAPKTKSEREVVELAGRPMTRGQIARSIGIGATVVPVIGVGRRSIGLIGRKMVPGRTVAQEIANVGSVAGDAISGVTFGAALPVVKRWADIEAARKGKF